VGESALPRPHPPSATVPPLPEGEGYFLDDGFCDFAFGSAQNDRVVWVVGKRISFRTRETNKKSLMLCALLLVEPKIVIKIYNISTLHKNMYVLKYSILNSFAQNPAI